MRGVCARFGIMICEMQYNEYIEHRVGDHKWICNVYEVAKCVHSDNV